MAEVKEEPEPRGPCGPWGPSGLRVKEEPEDELPVAPVAPVGPVKTEDDEDKSSVLHQSEENREETNGWDCGAEAGCSSVCEEEHLKVEEELLNGEDDGAESDWSWEWEGPPLRQTLSERRTASTMGPNPDFVFPSVRQEPPVAPDAPVKTEDDEDKSSVLHQSEENREETNGWDCGAEAGCSSDPLTQFHSDTEEEEDEERPHKCSFCGKCFKNTSHFNQHLKIHSGDKPYSCSVCKKAFLRSRTLTEHLRTHTGEKPFRCSVCKNDFTSKARMKKHMKVHTGEKPFSCPFCTKSFVQRSFLVIHVRQHTGEKPFSCSVCHRSYTDKSSLRKHVKKHQASRGRSVLYH